MKGLRTQKRRRKECKTDYKNRLNLLKSGKPRIVIRRTNKYFIVQAIKSNMAQDKVIASVTSRDLINEGWDKKFSNSLKSIPAGYLTGLLLGTKLDGKQTYIIDLGMTRNIHGNRSFAVIKGLIDSGLDIHANESVFPNKDRLNGEHLNPEVKKIFDIVKVKLEGSKNE